MGLAVLLLGLVLRAWSMQVLADAWRYLGSLLIGCGFALASSSTLIVGIVAALLVPTYLHRIAADEELLERDLPGHADYQKRTGRLVPHVW
jgi:protein-S-isoprenylcysteine O-methyltransferase Ste14